MRKLLKRIWEFICDAVDFVGNVPFPITFLVIILAALLAGMLMAIAGAIF